MECIHSTTEENAKYHADCTVGPMNLSAMRYHPYKVSSAPKNLMPSIPKLTSRRFSEPALPLNFNLGLDPSKGSNLKAKRKSRDGNRFTF